MFVVGMLPVPVGAGRAGESTIDRVVQVGARVLALQLLAVLRPPSRETPNA